MCTVYVYSDNNDNNNNNNNILLVNRLWADIVGDETEHIYGGGEQYTYLDLKGRNYPIWVREQGVGRNKSDIVTIVMDALYHGGGDYHTTYWPQPSYLSSRSGRVSHRTSHHLVQEILRPVNLPRLPRARLQYRGQEHLLLALQRPDPGGG